MNLLTQAVPRANAWGRIVYPLTPAPLPRERVRLRVPHTCHRASVDTPAHPDCTESVHAQRARIPPGVAQPDVTYRANAGLAQPGAARHANASGRTSSAHAAGPLPSRRGDCAECSTRLPHRASQPASRGRACLKQARYRLARLYDTRTRRPVTTARRGGWHMPWMVRAEPSTSRAGGRGYTFRQPLVFLTGAPIRHRERIHCKRSHLRF